MGMPRKHLSVWLADVFLGANLKWAFAVLQTQMSISRNTEQYLIQIGKTEVLHCCIWFCIHGWYISSPLRFWDGWYMMFWKGARQCVYVCMRNHAWTEKRDWRCNQIWLSAARWSMVFWRENWHKAAICWWDALFIGLLYDSNKNDNEILLWLIGCKYERRYCTSFSRVYVLCIYQL